MNDRVLVGVHERIGNLHAVAERLIVRQAVGRKHVAQRPSIHVLHRDKDPTVGFTDLVDGTDVRVIQGRGQPRLPFEPRQTFRIGREGVRQDLERHLAIQSRVASLVHLAHAARAEETANLVHAEAPALQLCRRSLVQSRCYIAVEQLVSRAGLSQKRFAGIFPARARRTVEVLNLLPAVGRARFSVRVQVRF